MKLKLKEDPREWRKFALLCCGVLLLGAGTAYGRGYISIRTGSWIVGPALVLAIMALLRPRWFGPFYRAAMRISFRVGQVLGKVLLGALYLVVLTPLGWALRLSGKDPLEAKLDPQKSSYWKSAKGNGRLEDQF